MDLAPNGVWTSDPLPFSPGDYICLRCDSGVKFYAGLFDEEAFQTALNRNAVGSLFPLWSDRVTFDKPLQVNRPSTYRIVVKIGVWAQAGHVTLTLWKAEAGPSSPVVSSTPRQNWKTYLIIAIAAALAAFVVIVVWYDFAVITLGNGTEFFTAIGAETPLFAALVAGVYFLWRKVLSARRP